MRSSYVKACMIMAAAMTLVGRAHAQEGAYTVKPGDSLLISVWKEPDLQGNALVTPDGTFAFPLIGLVDVKGKTVAEVQRIAAERLSKYISDPVVTVSIQEVKGNKVYVIGQVNKPGEFIVNPRVDVMQALSMAGGTTAFAALNDIIILRKVGDKRVALPFRYAEVAKGRSLDQNIDLQAGDTVVVP